MLHDMVVRLGWFPLSAIHNHDMDHGELCVNKRVGVELSPERLHRRGIKETPQAGAVVHIRLTPIDIRSARVDCRCSDIVTRRVECQTLQRRVASVAKHRKVATIFGLSARPETWPTLISQMAKITILYPHFRVRPLNCGTHAHTHTPE
jgi:hypothetical protein